MLIEAWADQRNFKPKVPASATRLDNAGNPSVDFRAERRMKAMHASRTDPKAKLCPLGHALMENHGLVGNATVTQVTDTADHSRLGALVQPGTPASGAGVSKPSPIPGPTINSGGVTTGEHYNILHPLKLRPPSRHGPERTEEVARWQQKQANRLSGGRRSAEWH